MKLEPDDTLLLSLVNHNFTNTHDVAKTQVYRKRWLMLGLFILVSIANLIHYPQYEVISNILVGYYNVSSLTISWTALCFMVTYIVFSFPGLYILEKLGIRRAILVGVIGITIGAWIKVVGVEPNRFWLAFVGQTIASVAQVLIIPLPPKLAAIWFSDSEVATACSLGVSGSQVGVLFGFLMPPFFIYNGPTIDIERGLYVNSIITAVFCTLTGIAIYFYFKESPPKPPTVAQLKALQARSISKTKFRESFQNLTTNKSFMLFSIVYGFNIGLFFPFSVFINNIMLYYYFNVSPTEVSTLGALAVAALTVGALFGGLLLDKYKCYKSLILLFVVLNMCIFLIISLFSGCTLWIFDILVSLLGFTSGAICTIGYEIGMELTYPESEGISGAILACSYQLFAVILCSTYYLLYTSVGFPATNSILFVLLVAVDLLIIFIKFDLQRQRVATTEKSSKF